MYELDIRTKKGTRVGTEIVSQPLLRIGKDRSNDVVLHGWRIAKFHAQMLAGADGTFLESIQGQEFAVNGRRCEQYGPFENEDIVTLGDYVIKVRLSGSSKSKVSMDSAQLVTEPSHATAKQPAPIPLADSSQRQVLAQKIRGEIHQKLFQIMDLRRVNVNAMGDDELRAFAKNAIDEIIKNFEGFPTELKKEEIGRQVLCEAVGLGPLEDLLDRDDVSEVMVNAHDQIFYEVAGQILRSDICFTDDRSVLSAIERIVAPIGRRIDESSPLVDARLKDGSRVNAIIPPLALKGPCITIRKFMKERLTSDDLVRFGSLNDPMVRFLEMCILKRKNVVISGGTGSGKTTLLNMLSNFIPDDERIVTVEDAAELKLYQPNLVSLEARPPNQEGKGAVPIRDLVKNCLRMRPDRIVVGECRGGEALDMLQAMNTGHDGSLTTVHSNSPRDCISRLEVLVLMSGMELPVRAIREQISSAVDIIVQQTRFSCGSRKITSITEVTGVEGETVQLAEIFRYRQSGYDDKGKISGQFEATSIIPEFYEDLRRRGIEVDLSIFKTEVA